ncbi:MAG: hypothetical protein EOO73_32385 [Myxococcales bacterium]|nr:MAG: hypothetical protein EOO73_32385 [Myxococcales bacterium]
MSKLLSFLRSHALGALVFVFPLVYYFRFVFPNSGLLILQNDFGYLYFVNKSYLLDMWAHGVFPLWSPTESCGYGFFGNPFAAVLYPPNLLLLLVRLATGGYGTWLHQVFTVLGVSWFALGLYRWLMRCFGHEAAAAFAAIAVSTCWMVGEFLRFPNAIHVLAWLPWGLSALHGLHHERRLRFLYYATAAIFCQTTAGYPYFVVYSMLLYVAYALYLNWSTDFQDWKPRSGRLLLALAAPTLITLPYTSAISQLMGATTDRDGGNYHYAVEYTFGPLDFVGSLVFPPVVTVEGCFYAGTLVVFLMVVYFRHREDPREKLAVLLGMMLFLSLMFGFRSFLFAPVWSFTPIINQMRVFGRMATMLLPILAVIVYHGYRIFAEQLARPKAERVFSPHFVWASFGGIFAVQAYLYLNREPLHGEYARLTVPTLPAKSLEIDFLMYTLLTLAVVLIVSSVEWQKVRSSAALGFVALVWVMAQDTGTEGRYHWAQPIQQSYAQIGAPERGSVARRVFNAARVEGNYYRLITEYFSLDRNPGSGQITWQGLSRGIIPNWYFDRYVQFLRKWGSEGHTLNRLLGTRKLFFHTEQSSTPQDFLANVRSAEASADAAVVQKFDGNELLLEVSTRAPGHLAWIDNWDPGWSAEVDGRPTGISLLLGSFKTVALPTAGKHVVRFHYRPVISRVAFVGLLLGVGGLLLPLWLARRQRRAAEPSAA